MAIPKPSPSFLKAVALLAFLSLTPVTLYLLYNRTGGPASQKELALQKNLRFAFMAGVDLVDVVPLTPYPWVKMCALANGVTQDEMTAIIGFPYKDYSQLHWLPRPEYWTLMFIDAEREANWGKATPVTPVRIPRKDVADLSLPSNVKGVCVSRLGGKLNLTRRLNAEPGTSPVIVRLVEYGEAAPIVAPPAKVE
jgi:hypothetical protein